MDCRAETHSKAYLSELTRDFLASVGITYAVFRIAKSRLMLSQIAVRTGRPDHAKRSAR